MKGWDSTKGKLTLDATLPLKQDSALSAFKALAGNFNAAGQLVKGTTIVTLPLNKSNSFHVINDATILGAHLRA